MARDRRDDWLFIWRGKRKEDRVLLGAEGRVANCKSVNLHYDVTDM